MWLQQVPLGSSRPPGPQRRSCLRRLQAASAWRQPVDGLRDLPPVVYRADQSIPVDLEAGRLEFPTVRGCPHTASDRSRAELPDRAAPEVQADQCLPFAEFVAAA